MLLARIPQYIFTAADGVSACNLGAADGDEGLHLLFTVSWLDSKLFVAARPSKPTRDKSARTRT